MVVAGNFSARLVDPESKKPFKEHVGPNGEVYAEVEPEAEYLIELQTVGGDQTVAFHCFVDGKRLPTHVKSKPWAPPHFLGLRDEATNDKMALCFRSPTILEGGNSLEALAMMGSVTVQASEIVPLGSKPRRKFTQEVFRAPSSSSTTNPSSSLTCATTATSSTSNCGSNGNNNGGSGNSGTENPVKISFDSAKKQMKKVMLNNDDNNGVNDNNGMDNTVRLPFDLAKKQKKKVLRSVAGNILEPSAPVGVVTANKATTTNRFITTTKKKNPTKLKQTGDMLQEININYCTALGLIHAGILPKPPLWEQHRLTRGLSKKECDGGDSEPIAPSKRVKIDAIFAGDTMVSDAREVEIFDLTGSED